MTFVPGLLLGLAIGLSVAGLLVYLMYIGTKDSLEELRRILDRIEKMR